MFPLGREKFSFPSCFQQGHGGLAKQGKHDVSFTAQGPSKGSPCKAVSCHTYKHKVQRWHMCPTMPSHGPHHVTLQHTNLALARHANCRLPCALLARLINYPGHALRHQDTLALTAAVVCAAATASMAATACCTV